MKTREEFIKSVWEKSEQALAAQQAAEAQNLQADSIASGIGESSQGRGATVKACEDDARARGDGAKARKDDARARRDGAKVRRRKMYGGAAAAAACLLLAAGAAGLGGPQEIYDMILGSAGEDGAVEEAMGSEGYCGNTDENFAPDTEMPDSLQPQATDNSSVTADTADTEVKSGSTVSPYGGELLKENKGDANNRADSVISGLYFLPAGIEIADSTGNAEAIAGEDNIIEYMEWFYSLPEDQVLTEEEFKKLDTIPTDYYKFTMDCSMGEDTEGADRVYWLVGGVSLP